MTFKHMKFEDSPTMRALEKVAKEKGLVKPETLQKSAAVTKKADYTPTANLMENIFKLAAGLRAIGLTKEATEVESNYLKYKQAQTLYETSKEKGEDVLQEAHPKGSHKLEGIDGEEATVEDIIDQHLKMMKVVEKKPTGKLSEAKSKDILKAVRIVLAASKEEITAQLRDQMRALVNAVTVLDTKTSGELTVPLSGWFGSGYLSHIQQLASNPTIDNLKQLQSLLSKMRFRLKPGLTMGLSEDKWSQVAPFLDKADSALAKGMDLRTQYNQAISSENQQDTPAAETEGENIGGRQGVTTVMSPEGKQFLNQVNGWLGQLKSWAVTVNNDPENTDADKQQANEWINSRTAELTGLRDKFMGEQDPNEQNQKASGYLSALNKSRFARESAQFQRGWIG